MAAPAVEAAVAVTAEAATPVILALPPTVRSELLMAITEVPASPASASAAPATPLAVAVRLLTASARMPFTPVALPPRLRLLESMPITSAPRPDAAWDVPVALMLLLVAAAVRLAPTLNLLRSAPTVTTVESRPVT